VAAVAQPPQRHRPNRLLLGPDHGLVRHTSRRSDPGAEGAALRRDKLGAESLLDAAAHRAVAAGISADLSPTRAQPDEPVLHRRWPAPGLDRPSPWAGQSRGTPGRGRAQLWRAGTTDDRVAVLGRATNRRTFSAKGWYGSTVSRHATASRWRARPASHRWPPSRLPAPGGHPCSPSSRELVGRRPRGSRPSALAG
jgi:hypothetical protein